MAKRGKYIKPAQRRVHSVEVVSNKQISPNFRRITLGGNGLDGFESMGYDQWFRLFMPGHSGLRLPTATSTLWFAQYLMMGKEHRPLTRNYTVREFRPAGADGPELDIDFAVHDPESPAATWAIAAALGDRVGLLDEGITYQPPEHTGYTLLAGDASALPAVAGVLRDVPRDLRGAAYLEIAHADDAQDLGEPEGVQVHWLIRADSAAPWGQLAADAVRTADLPGSGVYGFLAGEQNLVAGLRRHLVHDRGIPKADVTFTGYWREGKSQG
ncbi:siderophore-interacting protein [Nocardia stercoris]|uniref:Siderophore-interacting protein n=1 Tax=Nocardia stercoris TaxID=2483361 RepID=A0A3M2KVX2_9NOCA|nr:siderophore-interacting protein [Nocardia stercoris]RMI28363.1 siderophore-interacting protein [Nocardia stercoris]